MFHNVEIDIIFLNPECEYNVFSKWLELLTNKLEWLLETGISSRPPLVSDISMDDEAEYDTTEHDWRRQLEILHAG